MQWNKPIWYGLAMVLVSALVSAVGTSKLRLREDVHEKVIGLVPPDMVFISGNEKMHSFWIGASEEPNMNYVIYLKWLKQVFGSDFPGVYDRALPNNKHPEINFTANDPYLNNYMTHPAFSQYPVTGLSWLQIQDYMIWKTDRLNEYNLIRFGIMEPNASQVNSDNFNTQAYLVRQYEGAAGNRMLRDLNPTGTGTRRPEFGDGIFCPSYRLPTEQEWEYASQEQFQLPFTQMSKSKKQARDPIGYSEFLMAYSDLFGFDVQQAGANDYRDYLNSATDSNNLPQRLSSINDYDWRYYGVANMKGNVREWTASLYSDTYDGSETDARKAYVKSGFTEIDSSRVYDREGQYFEKDSIGRLPFILFGVDGSGNYDQLMQYNANGNYKGRVVRGGNWQKPGTVVRAEMMENASAADVGFRCAMSYTGIPFTGWKKVRSGYYTRAKRFYEK